jgi:hypothetical protein
LCGGEPVFRNRRVRLEKERRADLTTYGGLALAHQLVKAVGLDQAIDGHVEVLKIHRPYHESDHVLAHAYNLFLGGTCIQDLEGLQRSEAVHKVLGAGSFPDPTTAGDFLRRFSSKELKDLQSGIDESRLRVWRSLPARQRKKATLDIDSSLKEVYGECKEGADFSYRKTWSYHPLLVTLAESNECLRVVNRPGNVASAADAPEVLGEALELARGVFGKRYVRADTAFCNREMIAICEEKGARFALAKEANAKVVALAESLSRRAWKPFEAHPERHKKRRAKARKKRKRQLRRRRRRARARRYQEVRREREWVAEALYQPHGCQKSYRLVIRRQKLRIRDRQGELFTDYRYRFVLTDIPKSEKDAAAVTRFYYQRCDQENAIEQAKNGLHGFRMPTGTLLANGAFLLAAQVAWCLKSWLSLVALPAETLRWEWKRFRHAFVYVAARVVTLARDVVVRVHDSHRWCDVMLRAHERLRAHAFP